MTLQNSGKRRPWPSRPRRKVLRMRRAARSPRATSEIIVSIGFAIGRDRLRRRLDRRLIVVADALVAFLSLGNLAMPRLFAGGKRMAAAAGHAASP